jgi:hypothetical protein
MPTIIVPSPLRRYTEGQSRVPMDDGTVSEAIDNVEVSNIYEGGFHDLT